MKPMGLMKQCLFHILLILLALHGAGQCSDADPGQVVYKETFGGNFSTGNFGSAPTAFNTSYTFKSSGSIAVGEFGIRKARPNINNWVEGSDHTGNGGFMMMVRSNTNNPVFFEKDISNNCSIQTQAICFWYASLNAKGSAREVQIKLTVTDLNTNQVIASQETPVLKNEDSLVWSNLVMAYQIPVSPKGVRVSLSLSSTTPIPDDFAIDDIRIVNTNAQSIISSFFLNINNAPIYTYPFYVCRDAEAAFTIKDLSPSQMQGKMFQWQRLKEDYTYEDIPGANQPTFLISAAQRDDSRFYQLRMADSGNIYNASCYTISYPIGLRVDPKPVIVSNGPICEGQDLELSISEGTTAYWIGPNGYTNTGNKIRIPKATAAASGKYTAQALFSPGCNQTVDTSLVVTINPNPIQIQLPTDTVICAGKSLLLQAGDPLVKYKWSTGDTLNSILVSKTGVYDLYAYKDGCYKQTSINVDPLEPPIIKPLNDTSICLGDTIKLQPSTQFARTFLWNNGLQTPSIHIHRSGNYQVQVANACGNAKASFKVETGSCFGELLIPNAFTPNRDGLNDVFKPSLDFSIKNYRMNIYNRWGAIVFSSNNMRIGWDGMLNRLEQPAGTYIWQVNYLNKTNQKKEQRGTVLLIR
jgi:gliding motility-associated-like protein